MKCPNCEFVDDTPMIDKFTADGPFVLRNVWFQHFKGHGEPFEICLSSLDPKNYIHAAISKRGLVNEMI